MTKKWSSTASMDGQTKRQASKSDRQVGKLMVRHVIDGHEILLPADARLHPKLTPDDPLDMSDPLGGTY